MIEKVFAVYDLKAGQYLPLFQANTYGVAERSFGEAVNSKDHQFSKYPEDYRLMHLGDLDTESGLIEPCQPVLVATAEQVKNGQDNSIPSINPQ